MKFLFILVTAIFFSAASFAQGTLVFSNRTPTGDARIALADGRGAGSIPGITAQLYLVGAGGVLGPLYPTTTFRDTSEAAMFFVKEVNPFVVEGVRPGESATFRLRIYQGSSFEAAAVSGCLIFGQSPDFTVPQLGGILPNGEVIPPAYLNGLSGFTSLSLMRFLNFDAISLDGGNLRFDLSMQLPDDGLPGGCWTNFVLEASSDLTTWQPPLLTNPPPSFRIPYNPASDRNRFFRLRTVQ